MALRLPRTKRFAAIVAAVSVSLIASGVAFSLPEASAAPASCYAGGTVRDGGGQMRTKYYCHNYRNTPVYDSAYSAGNNRDVVYGGTNWVLCQTSGRQNPVPYRANYQNNIWLETMSDTGRWGWMPATYVSQGGDYQLVPGVTICPYGGGK